MSTVELLIEVRCEEIPARFVAPAMDGFVTGVQKLLGALLVGEVARFSTPRRLAIRAQVLAARPTVEKLVTGMPLAQAKNEAGWTPGAVAFAKKRGVDPSALIEHNGFAAVAVTEGGERAAEVIASGLEALVLGIPFKKTMRWGESPVRFARPLHDVLCVLNGQRVESVVGGLPTCAHSVGHWLLSPEAFPVSDADGWLNTLRDRGVFADRAERRAVITEQLAAAALASGLSCTEDATLLDEVTDLVESPFTIVGTFPASLLRLPPRLLIESMKVNQRYFPLFDGTKLTNRFLVVTNNPRGDAALMASGNARVLTARFHDAVFFFDEDHKRPLLEHAARLGGMVWIRGLGTMAERQAEITAAAVRLCGVTGAEIAVVRRLGGVLKADLGTLMVGEFPELQGHIGHLLAQGEGYEEAIALEEAWLPRFAGDALPTTAAGRCFALAERITLLSRCFAAEMEPKGTADPQGLRRAGVGLVALLQQLGSGTLHGVFAQAGVPLPVGLAEFVLARLRASLLSEGHATDLVDAVLSVGGGEVAAITRRVRGLSALPKGEMSAVRTTFRRVAGLGKEHGSAAYTIDLLQGEAEFALHLAILALPDDTDALLPALQSLRPVVDRFFDSVLVMSDDLPVRHNRLGMLRAILDRFGGFADFARLSGEAS